MLANDGFTALPRSRQFGRFDVLRTARASARRHELTTLNMLLYNIEIWSSLSHNNAKSEVLCAGRRHASRSRWLGAAMDMTTGKRARDTKRAGAPHAFGARAARSILPLLSVIFSGCSIHP